MRVCNRDIFVEVAIVCKTVFGRNTAAVTFPRTDQSRGGNAVVRGSFRRQPLRCFDQHTVAENLKCVYAGGAGNVSVSVCDCFGSDVGVFFICVCIDIGIVFFIEKPEHICENQHKHERDNARSGNSQRDNQGVTSQKM